MKATPQQQLDLLDLADLDEEIRLLEHRRGNLEEQKVLERHEETRELVTTELAEASRTKDRLTAQSAKHEREIEAVNSARKSKEAQIYSGQIKDERSLEAIREEVRDMQRRKNDLEDSLLEIMEQLEEISSLVDELTSRRRELADQITDLAARRDAAAADIDVELAGMRGRRDERVAAIDDGILGVYEDLRAKRGGRAVARLAGKTCKGCHMELTAIDVEEIKAAAATGLATCQQCGTVLVVASRA